MNKICTTVPYLKTIRRIQERISLLQEIIYDLSREGFLPGVVIQFFKYNTIINAEVLKQDKQRFFIRNLKTKNEYWIHVFDLTTPIIDNDEWKLPNYKIGD